MLNILKIQLKNPNHYIMVAADALAISASLYLSYLFRFDFAIPETYLSQFGRTVIWILPLKILLFYSFRLYMGMWRYTSLNEVWRLLQAVVFSELIVIGAITYFYRFQGYPRSVFVIDPVFTFVLTGGIRIAIRAYYERARNSSSLWGSFTKPAKGISLLVVGAGGAGEKVVRELLENRNLPFSVKGFVDDDPGKQNRLIHGIPVMGKTGDLPELVQKKGIQEVLIAMPSAPGEKVREIVHICENERVKFRILPSMGDLIHGKVSIKSLRDVSYVDLLGRPAVSLDDSSIAQYLEGQTILVSGCGGSIGSELCRQIVRYNPGLVLLVDSSEENLYAIQTELHYEFQFTRFKTILGRVHDARLMDHVFSSFHPAVIFHAAAYKHVPMLETNPWEGVLNNILGTQVIMDMATKHEAKRFVLISTDKAVRPTNVMGSTKRVAELMMQCLDSEKTKFMAVRFGNVIGSSGSVVPLFRRQIEKGGPVTVTHPEVTRYFMTIAEAVQLILQAGSMGEGGEIFILEMGTPVKISEMARELIILSGKDPDRDVPVVFTGLRPGEKLYEELITEGEGIVATRHEKIHVIKPGSVKSIHSEKYVSSLKNDVSQLIEMAKRQDAIGIRQKLQQMLPEADFKYDSDMFHEATGNPEGTDHSQT